MKYTVIFTTNNRAGTLVHMDYVSTSKNISFEKALNKKDIDIAQVVAVFPGKQEQIITDWSKL